MTAITFKDGTITYQKGASIYTDKIVLENKVIALITKRYEMGFGDDTVVELTTLAATE